MNIQDPTHKLVIQLLEVDMSSKGISDCAACSTTEATTRAAIQVLKPAFDEMNCELFFEKITIHSLDEAIAQSFVSSPTIRIGRLRFFPQHSSHLSEERLWLWNGQTMRSISKAIIMQMILKGYAATFEDLMPGKISDYVLHYLSTPKEAAPARSCCS